MGIQYISEILPNIDQFYLTDKADGIRTILIFNNTEVLYVNNSNIPICIDTDTNTN